MYDRDGLFVLVKPNGSKLWRYRYFMGGKEQLMALGEYPIVTLASARELFQEAHKKLASGIDPMAERRALSEAKQRDDMSRKREEATSFQSVARQWWIRGQSASRPDTQRRPCAVSRQMYSRFDALYHFIQNCMEDHAQKR